MKQIILLLLTFSFINVRAQDTVAVKSNWEYKGVSSVNISQIAFSNWTAGGDDAITYTLIGNFAANYTVETWSLRNSLKVSYGQTKLGDDDFKINDNELYQETVYSRKFGWAVDPYVSNTIRTNVAPGYQYAAGDSSYQTSDIFDPGYISQSIGFTYDKSAWAKTRLGVGFQEIFTSKYPNYTDDPDTPDELETFKFETGIESVSDFDIKIMENVVYKAKLRLFTRFNDIEKWDVRWDNTFTSQINKHIVVNFALLLIYDESQSMQRQIKQGLQVGLTYNLI